MPKFSVVIPTFNREELVERAIDSVVAQTLQDFEILVIDDGSIDNTRLRLQTKFGNRIKYFYIPNSGGPATPRNLGIDHASGDWICFLDADDIWHPRKLERVSLAMTGDVDAMVICHDEVVVNTSNGREKIIRSGPWEEDFYRKFLIAGNRVLTSGTCVRRKLLTDNKLRFDTRADYVIIEDYDFWLRIARLGVRFCFVPSPLATYTVDGNGISSNLEKMRANVRTMLMDHAFGSGDVELASAVDVRLAIEELWLRTGASRDKRWIRLMLLVLANPRQAIRYVWLRLQRVYMLPPIVRLDD